MKLLGFDITRTREKVEENKFWTGGASTGIAQIQIPPSPIADALSASLSGNSWYNDPRTQLGTYRLIYHCFPQFQRASQIRQNFVGCMEVICEDPKLKLEIELFIERFKIYSQHKRTNDDVGLERLLKNRLLNSSLMDGRAFSELRRDEVTGEVIGALCVPSELFTYQILDGSHWDLVYQALMGGRHVIDESAPDVISFSNDPGTNTPWGYPMAYGADYMANNAIRLIEAKVAYETRIGNPTGITTIGMDQSFDPDKYTPTERTEMQSRMQEVVNVTKESAQRRMKFGKASDIILTMSAPIRVGSTFYGEGVSAGSPEAAMMTFTDWMVLRTGVPGTFIGLPNSPGLGSDIYKEQRSFLEALAKDDAKALQLESYHIIDQYLMSIKASPASIENYEIQFNKPEMNDELIEAQAELTEAQALQQQLMNFQQLQTMNPDEATAYAEEIGLPGLEYSADPMPEV